MVAEFGCGEKETGLQNAQRVGKRDGVKILKVVEEGVYPGGLLDSGILLINKEGDRSDNSLPSADPPVEVRVDPAVLPVLEVRVPERGIRTVEDR